MQTTLNFLKKPNAEANTSALAKPTPVPLSPFAETLISNLKAESWKKALQPEFQKPYFQKLTKWLEGEGKFFPPPELVFNAYNKCPLDSVRVVILGQDPYINPGQAMGMSFSVPPGITPPPSLKNIYKELESDLGPEKFKAPNHGDLTHWAEQGVMLLNAVLTVKPGDSNSHQHKGWEEFTDATIRIINEQRKGVVFLLWGKPAQAKGKLVDGKKHHVLTAAHPSPFAADKGFFGCKHFSKTNAFLSTPIIWQLPLTGQEKRPAAAAAADVSETSPKKARSEEKKGDQK